MAYGATIIAYAILAEAQVKEIPVSPLKLQKLLYYAQGLHLAHNGETLFTETLEAWEHGPVVPCVYKKFKRFSHTSISGEISRPTIRSTAALATITLTLFTYGHYHAKALEKMTHSELPWTEAFNSSKNQPIRVETMRDFFKQAKNSGPRPSDKTEARGNDFAPLLLDSETWEEINARLNQNTISDALERFMSTPTVLEKGHSLLRANA